MFTGFFFELRKEGIPVSLSEWYTLIHSLALGMAGSSLLGFYHLARALLVKNEAFFDQYDRVFLRYFQGIETTDEFAAEVLEWLNNGLPPLDLSPEEREDLARRLQVWDLEELKRQFEQRLKEQDGEHHGGGRWVGTGGTSPFGHSGYHPAGIRVGGASHSRSAVKVAAERKFKEYRTDTAIGVRQFQVALRELRQLSSKNLGPKDQLDLESTVKATADNAGFLKLVFERERKNKIKVLLLMDVGGSMYYHAQVCNQLFAAVNRVTHFQDLKIYYFHNTIYHTVYENAACKPADGVSTDYLLKTLDADYRVFLVGDACMAPSELTMPGGIIWWGEDNEEASIVWLGRLRQKWAHSVWINPIPKEEWETVYGSQTLRMVGSVFPMFELTVQGLQQGVRAILKRHGSPKNVLNGRR